LWILKIFSPEQFFIAKREKNHPRRIMIMNMKRIIVVWPMLLILALTLLAGCASSSGSSPNTNAPLSADNINLIFVVSPDLAYNTPGDIQPDTANLSNQGLQRSLLMATYLKQQVLGGNNVTAIYALSPMTHLQTTKNYPDMAAIGFIQQFALLNQINLIVDASGGTYTGNSFPIYAAYAPGSVPNGVSVPYDASVPPVPSYCPTCTGLDFNNTYGNNDTLVSGIIKNNIPGYYVFSAPWETISTLMATINAKYGYNLNLPATYMGTNYVYVISITPSGDARLVTYNSNLHPPATYPVLPSPVATTACTQQQPYFKTVRAGGVGGVVIPSNANTNQTIYIIRHADAHPDPEFGFEDGNFVGAGQWRALALSNALRGKISPTMVYSIDPAQWYTVYTGFNVSYVRPSLTILPYAIDNNLPYSLASNFLLSVDPLDSVVAQNTSDFFFTHSNRYGVNLSNQTVLLAWESGHIRPFLNALLASYGGNPPVIPTLATAELEAGGWPHTDYDTIWTVTLDAHGNLTVDNALCEGINSATLPATAPLF
jgi:hypothetical protein